MEREKDIDNYEKFVNNVHDIVKDIATLVEEGDPKISNSILKYMMNINDNI